MEDSRSIENLIYSYAERIDSGDLEGVAELFRKGEIVSSAHGVRQAGYDDVLSLYQSSCRIYQSTGTPLTRHITTNVIIDISEEGDSATARSYYTVIQSTDSLPLQPIISGRYHDKFAKVNGTWQFKIREMIVDLIGDCSAHLLYDSAGLG